MQLEKRGVDAEGAWFMRVLIYIIYLLVATVSGNASAATYRPFTITISSLEHSVRSGGEVRIHVVLTNVSDHVIWVDRSPSKTQAEIHYNVRVRDVSGNDVKETKYGHAARAHEVYGSEINQPVKPGEKLEEDTLIGKQSDISSPGEYRIQLTRPASSDPKDGVIKSNEIAITITP